MSDSSVYVVGMHRSGTSAVAEVLAGTGFHPPRPDDRIVVSSWNARGNWESKRLTAFNDRLLARLGGSWSAPSALGAGWEDEPSLEEVRRDAVGVFEACFFERPAVWKDPRLSLLLPFWNTAVGPPAAAVLVQRDPEEVAGSLRARDGFGFVHGLALWERYVRSACEGLDGVPTFVTSYRRVTERPAEWQESVAGFLSDAGLPAEVTARASLDPSLHHHRRGDAPTGWPATEARRLMTALDELEGPHRRWRPPDLGPEPEWVSDTLAMRSRLESARRSLRDLEASRAYKVARWTRRLASPRGAS
jgi:hypothetical protein